MGSTAIGALRSVGVDERGGNPWLSAGRLPDLISFAPLRKDSDHDGLPTHVRTPEGEELSLFGEALAAEIGRRHGAPVQMMQLRQGIYDESSLSVIASATVREIGRLAESRADVRRFRPNLLVRSTRDVPFEEDKWVGGLLTFGEAEDAPAVAVTMRDLRCAMINIDPDGGESSPEVMKACVRANENHAGDLLHGHAHRTAGGRADPLARELPRGGSREPHRERGRMTSGRVVRGPDDPSDAKLDRRRLLAAGGLLFTSCGAGARLRPARSSRLDRLLDAHADLLPERAGAGANHYPMAAEALEAMGYEGDIDDSWIEGASLYTGELGRVKPIEGEADIASALGHYHRFGDWLDYFLATLRRESWHAVVARWAPRLAPAICAAAFHGVIRTGHAVRALRQRNGASRRNELAVGLAYWAARYVELPTTPKEDRTRASLRSTLADLSYPWVHDHTDVDFFAVLGRLTERPLAPPVALEEGVASPRADLDSIVHEAATAFLEMLVLERNRIWLLHTVTGPAAVQWLLPEVDRAGARVLVEYARQAVVAMYSAYGEPFTARAHVRSAPPEWPAQIQRAVDSRSVHGIKLIDALVRFDRDDDLLWRSVAAQWFEWT